MHPTAFSGKESGTAITVLEKTTSTNCQHACLWETDPPHPTFNEFAADVQGSTYNPWRDKKSIGHLV